MVDTSKTEEKAAQVAQRRDFDYAIELYLQVMNVAPERLEARKALRTVERRRANENGGGGLGKKVTGFLNRFRVPKKGDPDMRIKKCEEMLKDDPDHREVSVALGEALYEGGYNDSAIWVFEDLRSNYPTDKEVTEKLADLYEQSGQVEKALEVYEQLSKLDPSNRQVAERLTKLQAMKMQTTYQEGAQKGAMSITKDEKSRQQSIQGTELRTREQFLFAIEKEREKHQERPEDPNPLVKMGDLYMRIKEWEEAKKAFEEAEKLSPTEFRFKMKKDDVEIGRMQDQMKQEKDPNRKKEIYNKLMRFRLESFQKREQHYITDMSIAFELANIFFAFKKYDDAIKRYQKTIKDPKFRAEASLRLGESFIAKGQLDLAVRQLSEAIKGMEIMSDQKKELLYARGVAYEKQGAVKEAKTDFTAIYETDIDFKDVKKKVEG